MNVLIKKTLAGLIAASFSLAAPLASAKETAKSTEGSTTQANAAGSADAAAMTDGEIRKVDKGAGKLTIKHGELKTLGMPPMTMVFRVKDASILDIVKTGDKVSFVAEKVNGQFTVTRLEPKK